MALNFPGPYSFRMYYTITPASGLAITHSMRLNVDLTSDPAVGADFSAIDAVNFSAATKDLETLWADFIALLQPLMSAAHTEFNYVELWYCVPLSFEQNYVSVLDLSVAGTNGGNATPASQSIFTFRTREGGTMKLNLMEPVRSYGNEVQYTSMSADEKALCDFISDNVNEGWFLGADTSYPFAVAKLSPGQNEALFRARYRAQN